MIYEYYVNCGHTNEMKMITSSFHSYVRGSHNIHISSQLVEHCSANAEALGSNPVEAPKTFFGLTLRLLKS